jgi:hypothetical protein
MKRARSSVLTMLASLTMSAHALAQPSPSADVDAGTPAAVQPVPPTEAPALRPPPTAAQPEIESSIAPSDGLMTGDVVTWTLEVRSRETDEITVVDLEAANGEERGDALGRVDDPVHLLDQSMRREEPVSGRRLQVFAVRYLLLAPGEHVLPRLAVRVLTEDGQLGFVEPEPPTVTVASVLGNEPNAEPKPATDPVSVMEEDPRPKYVLGALAAMLAGALLAFFAARWWKRRSMRPAPPPPPRAPWVVAVEKLDVLKRSRDALMQEGRGVEWADGVSDAVREYLGARYGFDGLESTTDEVVERLRETKLGGITATEVAALLKESDLVKFAKAPIDGEAAESLLEGSYRIVRATTPTATTSAPGAARSGGGSA